MILLRDKEEEMMIRFKFKPEEIGCSRGFKETEEEKMIQKVMKMMVITSNNL